MEKFIPREKMSKTARRELDRRRRVLWAHSPVTKVVGSGKAYNRKRRGKPEDGDRVFLRVHTMTTVLRRL